MAGSDGHDRWEDYAMMNSEEKYIRDNAKRLMFTQPKSIKYAAKQCGDTTNMPEYHLARIAGQRFVLFMLMPGDEFPSKERVISELRMLYGFQTQVKVVCIPEKIWNKLCKEGHAYKPGEDHFA